MRCYKLIAMQKNQRGLYDTYKFIFHSEHDREMMYKFFKESGQYKTVKYE